MQRLLATLAVVLVLAAGLALAQPVGGNRYALLVGVREYDKSELRSLKYTENDVSALAALFKDSGYDRVVLLTQELGAKRSRALPTASNIRDELRGLLEDCNPGDTVVIGFTGHGVQFKGEDQHYFCPMDARLTDRKTLVPLSEVYDEMKKCKAGVKLLLVDACRNDPQSDLSKSVEGEKLESVTKPQLQRAPGGVAALFSCSAGQKSYESDDLKHGVFFHFILEALRGKAANADGTVGFEELASYAKRKVPVFVKEDIGARVRQVPHSVNDSVGAAVFAIFKRPGGEVPGRVRPPDDKEITLDLGGDQNMTLVRVPAGNFTMGSPESEKDRDKDEVQHPVTISKAFHLARTEVTRGQFKRFVNDASYKTEAEQYGKGGYGIDDAGKWEQKPEYTWENPGFLQTDEHPVVNVSWNDAVAFCEWLSRKSGQSVRLPTEAQWEYACRAGTTTAWHSGDDPEALVRVGNVADAEAKKKFSGWTTVDGNDGFVFTAPVGRFRANTFGLFDMHGNVNEWCQDWYGDYQTNARVDPAGAVQGSSRVFRGGSWNLPPRYCRSAFRYKSAPAGQYSYLGFRVCSRPAS